MAGKFSSIRRYLAPFILLAGVWLSPVSDATAQPNQYGVPIISNYPHPITGGSEQNWSITQDSRGVLYVGNNDKGVLEYDGAEWRTLPIPNDPIVRSMVAGDDGVLYVGAESEFGYLAPDYSGRMQYHSLSVDINRDIYPVAGVYKTYHAGGKVYFCTPPHTFIYDTDLQVVDIIENTPDAFLSFLVDTILYISDYGEGLMKFNGEQFEPVPGGSAFREMSITGIVRHSPQHLLIGTYYNGLLLFDLNRGTVDDSFINPAMQEYLEEGVITQIQPIGGDYAIATMYLGLVILNQDGQPKEIITENEGLIDQTIPWVYSYHSGEADGPVWIANFMGVSKLETNNPFRVFKEDAGFEGFVTDIKYFSNRLFISTFSGLYYKESSPTGTRFEPVPDIQGEDIRQLQVFRPSRGEELLIASSEMRTWIINPRLGVTELQERILDPSEDPSLAGEYAGKYLVQDPNRDNIIYTGRNQLVGLEYSWRGWTEVMRVDIPEEGHLRMEVDKYGFLWTTTPRSVIRVDISRLDEPDIRILSVNNGLPADEKNQVFLDPDNRTILVGTVDGLYRYNYFEDTFYRDTLLNGLLPEGKNLVHSFYCDKEGDLWLAFENEFLGWKEMGIRRDGPDFRLLADKEFNRLADVSADIFYSDPLHPGIWFGKSNELFYFDKTVERPDSVVFQTLIRRVSFGNDSVLFHGAHFTMDEHDRFWLEPGQDPDHIPQINHRFNNIQFAWSATFFEQEEMIRYSYKLEGFDTDWSGWNHATYKDFTNLPFGSYTLHVKAMNIYGEESSTTSYAFTILRPWYASILAILSYILLSGFLVYGAITLYTKRLKLENIRLEGIIAERTAEIRKQKEELTDSIEYASRIQRALLPSDRILEDHHLEHFILFRPRDIVSGDFFWMTARNDKLIIVVADCTGHGVPGAFMSMLGMTFLDEIVIKAEVTDTSEILDQLRDHVISALKQSGKTIRESNKDGMDLSIISIDLNSKEVQFSGAYNPIYLVRPLNRSEKRKINKGDELKLPRGSLHNDKYLLMQIRADQMPIGISEKPVPFTSSSFKYEGFSIYLFTDGYLDQFGGEKGKKFMSRNFKKMILELQSVPLKEQGVAMEKIVLNWMGNISQIDDILVMGIRIKQT
jgi:serine phosphatase RsbU (regulator of sigma subunit)